MKKGLIIGSIILLVIIIIVVLVLTLGKPKSKDSAEVSRLVLLKAQLNNPATPAEQKKTIADEIAALEKQLNGGIGNTITNIFSGIGGQKENTSSGSSIGMGGSGGGGSTPGSGVGGQSTAGFPLKNGARGENVVNVQKAINRKCNSKMPVLLVEDGVWSTKTQAALQSCYGVSQVDYALYQKMLSGESSYGGRRNHIFWYCQRTGITFYDPHKCQRSCGGQCAPVRH